MTLTLAMNFFGYDTEGSGGKSKNKQEGLHQTKNHVCSKGNNQQNEEAIYGLGEIFAKHISIKESISKKNKELI